MSDFKNRLDNMLKAFDGYWPPRSQFEGWPVVFLPYQNIADEIPEKLMSCANPEDFRSWMNVFLNEVDENAVDGELMQMLNPNHVHSVLLGFLSCLSFLLQSYRWGTLPVTAVERERRSLQMPQKLWGPFVKISNNLGLIHRGNAFSLITCNARYQDVSQSEKNIEKKSILSEDAKIVSWRFNFNQTNRILETEEFFYQSFLEMERGFKKSLFIISDYLVETERAKQCIETQKKNVTLDKRVSLITDLHSQLKAILKLFQQYVTESKIEPDIWANYVQSMIAWNINGVESGASGAESILFHILDEFLHIPGECILYKSAFDHRNGIPNYYRGLIDALKEGREYRFKMINAANDTIINPLQKARDDIIQCLGVWRLAHARISKKYLIHSKMTASGGVDKVYDRDVENLASRSEAELRERARETLKCISDRRKRRKSVELCEKEVMSVNYLSPLLETERKSYLNSVIDYCKSIFAFRTNED